jgi:hypothetical protein
MHLKRVAPRSRQCSERFTGYPEITFAKMPFSTRLNAGIWFWLDGFLRPDQSGDQVVEVGWVYVADGDDVEIWRSGSVESEACASSG